MRRIKIYNKMSGPLGEKLELAFLKSKGCKTRLKQKARFNWAIEGYENRIFFHGMARWSRNSVKALVVW